MRKLLVILLCAVSLSPSVEAGENKFLGTLASVSAASVTNISTSTPFAIPCGAKLTLYCTAAGRLLTDATVVAASGASKGLPIAASTYFPTSVGACLSAVSGNASAVVAWIANTGNADCDVWARQGTE